MKQTETFFEGEGDEWLKRNKSKLTPKNDLVLYALDQLIGVERDGVYLEIGCSNGWRLKELKDKYRCNEICGIDPSLQAIKEAIRGGVSAQVSEALVLPWDDEYFDVVIYGFCLYLCERGDLFGIIAEGDRILKNGGLMIIYDFNTNYPCRNPYKHKEGIWSYKQDYARMFLANPAYSVLFHTVKPGTRETQVTIMRKDLEQGWPECNE